MFEGILGEAGSSKTEVQDGIFGLMCSKPPEVLPDDIGETEWKSHNIGVVVEVGGESNGREFSCTFF
jgi:hypothetical protein